MNAVVISTSSEVGRHPVQVLQARSASFTFAPHNCTGLIGMLPIAVPALSGNEYRVLQAQLIPHSGKLDSSSPTSALERCAHISLDHRTFLQWMSRWNSRRMSQGLRVLVSFDSFATHSPSKRTCARLTSTRRLDARGDVPPVNRAVDTAILVTLSSR